jgi:anti-sigma B factor antagonist
MAEMSSFKLKLKPAGTAPVPVLSVAGELDMYTTPEFEEWLLRLVASSPRGLAVDLLDSTFLDSTASRALLRAVRRLRGVGGRLVVVNRDAEVARILDVMGLEEFLTVVASVEDVALALPAGVPAPAA